MAPHAVSWATVAAVLAPLIVIGVIRLLAEWQRRTTLVALLRHAPEGTVVIQKRGLGGPPMWVWVGQGPRPGASNTVLVLPPDAVMAVLPAGGRRG